MKRGRSKSGAPASAETQRANILRTLTDAQGGWVPSPQIAALAQQYNARVYELRRSGLVIENKTETDEATGVRHSWFRLAPACAQPRGTPAENVESDYMRRIHEDEARAMPLFKGLPL